MSVNFVSDCIQDVPEGVSSIAYTLTNTTAQRTYTLYSWDEAVALRANRHRLHQRFIGTVFISFRNEISYMRQGTDAFRDVMCYYYHTNLGNLAAPERVCSLYSMLMEPSIGEWQSSSKLGKTESWRIDGNEYLSNTHTDMVAVHDPSAGVTYAGELHWLESLKHVDRFYGTDPVSVALQLKIARWELAKLRKQHLLLPTETACDTKQLQEEQAVLVKLQATTQSQQTTMQEQSAVIAELREIVAKLTIDNTKYKATIEGLRGMLD